MLDVLSLAPLRQPIKHSAETTCELFAVVVVVGHRREFYLLTVIAIVLFSSPLLTPATNAR